MPADARATARGGARAARRQVGAVPVRTTPAGGTEVLLVTGRGSGRWIVPKGWPMRGLSDAAAAAREALEEAGVTGRVGESPVGAYRYRKGRGDDGLIEVTLYRLDVTGARRRFRERGQRTVRWFEPSAAAQLVDSPDLARAILAVAGAGGGAVGGAVGGATERVGAEPASWWTRIARALGVAFWWRRRR